jgi:hypothetical protein
LKWGWDLLRRIWNEIPECWYHFSGLCQTLIKIASRFRKVPPGWNTGFISALENASKIKACCIGTLFDSISAIPIPVSISGIKLFIAVAPLGKDTVGISDTKYPHSIKTSAIFFPYRIAVSQLHNCGAVYRETVPVHEIFRGQTVWQGEVEIFDLTGHPKAKRAYAWSYREGREDESERFVAVLEIPPVVSPVTAVRASIMADAKKRGKK